MPIQFHKSFNNVTFRLNDNVKSLKILDSCVAKFKLNIVLNNDNN